MTGTPKRLARDIQQMLSDEMKSLNIYYAPDDTNMMKGVALLFGPEGTPYENVPLIFSVEIPSQYPFESPKVLITTSDGATRFHPNLYTHGKVCLSILGTFSGPKWISTMNISTVFKSILSLLNENPIINEPGWERYTLEDIKARSFAEWVEYSILKHTAMSYKRFKHSKDTEWEPFRDMFTEVWPVRWAAIVEKIRARAAERGAQTYTGVPYGMGGTADWPMLLEFASSI